MEQRSTMGSLAVPASLPWETECPSLETAVVLEREAWGVGQEVSSASRYLLALLTLEDRIASVALLDRMTGQPLPMAWRRLLDGLAPDPQQPDAGLPRDALHRWLEVVAPAVKRIGEEPRVRLVRHHHRTVPHKADRQDSRTLRWLLKQPGRTMRERIGMAGKILTVRREATADTHENRVVRRVATRLARLAGDRLEAAAGMPAAERTGELSRLRDVVDRELDATPLGDVPGAVRMTSNNVLLGDPRYRRVWDANGWLARRQEDLEHAWRTGPQRLLHVISLTVMARLLRRAGVYPLRAFAELRVDGAEIGQWGLQATEPLEFVVAAAQPLLVRFLETERGLTVTSSQLRGERVVDVAAEETQVFGAVFATGAVRMPSDPEPIGRNRLERVLGISVSEGDATFVAPCDAAGLWESAGWILERLSLPEAIDGSEPLLSMVPLRLKPRPWTIAGWDLGGPVGWVARSTGAGHAPRPVAEPLGPVVAVAADHVGDPLTGGDAPPTSLGETGLRRLSVSEAWRRMASGDEVEPRLLQALLAMPVERDERVSPAQAVAVVVPEQVDELARPMIRAALPSIAGDCFLLDRAIAWVLAWRQAPVFRRAGVVEGDAVLLVDAGVEPAHTTILVARRDPSVEGSDGWYWERKLPVAPLAESQDLAVAREQRMRLEKEIEAARPGWPAAQIRHAAFRAEDEGLLAPGPGLPPTWLALEGPRAWLRMNRGGASGAEDGNLHPLRFERWLGQFLGGGYLARAVAEPGVKVHVLWVGQVAPSGRAGLERAVQDALPGAGFHTFHEPGALAAGAHNFLDRHLGNLPTYRDDVPDLYLEVSLGQWEKEQICIFSSKEPVRPGQAIESRVDTKFLLPAGQHSYRFPLLRGRETPLPSAFEAKLVDPSFPLRQATEVELKVEFRYAQDSFNVWVLPVHPGPLAPCRIEWVRGDAVPDGELPRQNERPSFPEPDDWGAVGEHIPENVEACWKDFATAFEATFDRRHIEKLTSPEGHRSKVDALKGLLTRLKEVDETCSQLWRSDRVAHAPPPALLALAKRTFFPRVMALAALGATDGVAIPKTYQKRLESSLEGMRPHALLLLCRLRAQAPTEAIDALIEGMEADSRATHGINPLHCMGWALADGHSPVRRRAVERVLRFLVRNTEAGNWARVEEALWALSTATWSIRPSSRFSTPRRLTEFWKPSAGCSTISGPGTAFTTGTQSCSTRPGRLHSGCCGCAGLPRGWDWPPVRSPLTASPTSSNAPQR